MKKLSIVDEHARFPKIDAQSSTIGEANGSSFRVASGFPLFTLSLDQSSTVPVPSPPNLLQLLCF